MEGHPFNPKRADDRRISVMNHLTAAAGPQARIVGTDTRPWTGSRVWCCIDKYNLTDLAYLEEDTVGDSKNLINLWTDRELVV